MKNLARMRVKGVIISLCLQSSVAMLTSCGKALPHEWSVPGGVDVTFYEVAKDPPGFQSKLREYVIIKREGYKKEFDVGSGGYLRGLRLNFDQAESVGWITATEVGGNKVYVAIVDLQKDRVLGGDCMWMKDAELSANERLLKNVVLEGKGVTLPEHKSR